MKVTAHDSQNLLLIDTDLIAAKIDTFISFINTIGSLKDAGIKASPSMFIAEMKNLIAVAESMTEDKLLEVINNLPKTKGGSIRKKSFPFYMSNLTRYTGGEGWCHIGSIELTIQPADRIYDTPISGMFVITFTYDRNYSKTDIPVLNKDLTVNTIVEKKFTYIDTKDLVQGKVYKNNKGKEFLFVGDVSNTYEESGLDMDGKKFHHKVGFDKFGNPKKIERNMFLALDNKTRKSIEKCKTFGEFLQQHFDKEFKIKEFPISPLYDYQSYKMVEEVETMFSVDDTTCVVTSGYAKGHFPKSGERYYWYKKEYLNECTATYVFTVYKK